MIKEVGMTGFGFTTEVDRPDKELVVEIGKYSSPILADVMGRFPGINPRIRSMNEGRTVCGPAITVRLRPADNLMLHKALDIAEPGDVLVVDTGSNYTNAPWGELLTLAAVKKGIGGLVIDGVIRDIAAIREIGFPVFACGTAPNGCDKDGPGEVNYPIALGGYVVNAGDVVLGDDDGVVIVPRHMLEGIVAKASAKLAQEEKRRAEIEEGIIVKADIEKTLRAKGVIKD